MFLDVYKNKKWFSANYFLTNDNYYNLNKYITNKDNQKEENKSVNSSHVSIKDVKDTHSERKINLKHERGDNQSNELKEKNKTTPVDKLEGIYSNDLSFGMELKDLWKFLRESNVLCVDFSLAQFNRLFFNGNKKLSLSNTFPSESIVVNCVLGWKYTLL